METTRPAEPEKIIPASPFAIIFRSPDLATEDDLPAPSAATERKAQRGNGRHSGSGGNRPRPRRN